MNIHEYQAKELLKNYGVPIVPWIVVDSESDVEKLISELPEKSYVVKAQVHTGGRGKAGGIKIAKNKAEAIKHIKAILGMTLLTNQTGSSGKLVRKVLVTEAVSIEKEYYISFLIDRSNAKYVFIASTEGGVEIEEVAKNTPDKIIKLHVDPTMGFKNEDGRSMVEQLGFSGELGDKIITIMKGMYELFTKKDATLIEINPLVLTKEKKFFAIDAKIDFDSNALYRHPDIMELRDLDEEDPNEVQASRFDLSYIKLDGTIGCLVNGAGLAMATMDIVKFYGGSPANFLDVGGSASTQKVTEAFKIILGDQNINGILVNIFGGIMKCDVIAEGIVNASKTLEVKVPIVARLDGTNIDKGKRILEESGLKIISSVTLEEAARRIVKEAGIYGNTRR